MLIELFAADGSRSLRAHVDKVYDRIRLKTSKLAALKFYKYCYMFG